MASDQQDLLIRIDERQARVLEMMEEMKKDLYQQGVVLTGNGNPASGLAFRVAALENASKDYRIAQEAQKQAQRETKTMAVGSVFTVLASVVTAAILYFFKI